MGDNNILPESKGLSHEYNKASSGHGSLLHWSHLALMITGMAFPMVATAAPLGSATLLDVVVQAGHSVVAMLDNTFEYTMPVLESVWDNALNGNFAPTTWDMGSMMPGMEAMDQNFDEWLRNAQFSGELEYALEDSQDAGMSLKDWVMSEYGHSGH